uniref:uncharacterized protein LOC122589975 isoform X2 n=1 Tax=Erigeron canadensis TaxID=72917 RepID=UPI001CB9C7BB|nr:uncharacterized protein LOC122589975 isoform X2 [Erigeron canadensis]
MLSPEFSILRRILCINSVEVLRKIGAWKNPSKQHPVFYTPVVKSAHLMRLGAMRRRGPPRPPETLGPVDHERKRSTKVNQNPAKLLLDLIFPVVIKQVWEEKSLKKINRIKEREKTQRRQKNR